MTDDAPTLLTVAETARFLRRSTEQVRRYLREGALPGRRLGGQWFIHPSDAEAFLQRRGESAAFHTSLAASETDPLAGAIGLGSSGGADIATGRIAYLRSVAEGRRG